VIRYASPRPFTITVGALRLACAAVYVLGGARALFVLIASYDAQGGCRDYDTLNPLMLSHD
jgi:hypothetical protein